MPSILQCERARLRFHQMDFEGMAAELDNQYNRKKILDAANGMAWLSDSEQLASIRNALHSFWMGIVAGRT